MKFKTIQKRIFSFIVSLCIFVGTVPLLEIPSSAITSNQNLYLVIDSVTSGNPFRYSGVNGTVATNLTGYTYSRSGTTATLTLSGFEFITTATYGMYITNAANDSTSMRLDIVVTDGTTNIITGSTWGLYFGGNKSTNIYGSNLGTGVLNITATGTGGSAHRTSGGALRVGTESRVGCRVNVSGANTAFDTNNSATVGNGRLIMTGNTRVSTRATGIPSNTKARYRTNTATSAGGTWTTVDSGASTLTLLAANTSSNIRYVEVETLYDITYNANGGSNAPSAQIKYFASDLTLSSSQPTRTGYTFVGWNTASNGSGTSYVSGAVYRVQANAVLYAQWTPSTYTVTLNQQSGTGGSSSVTATYNSAMPSATMPTRTGYTFGGYWTGTGGTGTQYYTAAGASARSWNLTSNTTLYAYWTANTYTVTLEDGTTITATFGEHLPKITPPTVPPIGFEEMKFIGYFDENGTQYYNRNGSSAKVWDIAENTTLYARWVNSITLLDIPDDSDLDVQARVVDLTKAVYKIDIEWGDMKFEYNLETAVAWNPGTHKYDGVISAAWSGMDGYNNQVIVTNHSNADVLVSLDVADNKLAADVEMEIYTIIDNTEEKTENLPLARVPYNGAAQNEADSVDSYLRLDGEPSAADITLLKNNHYTRVGTITVTIEPNGNGLTPF